MDMQSAPALVLEPEVVVVHLADAIKAGANANGQAARVQDVVDVERAMSRMRGGPRGMHS